MQVDTVDVEVDLKDSGECCCLVGIGRPRSSRGPGSWVEASGSSSDLGEVRTVGRKGQSREKRDEIKHWKQMGEVTEGYPALRFKTWWWDR